MSSTNRGRDEYPLTLTDAFDLPVRESGKFDTVKSNRRFNGRGGRGRRGSNYMFAQRGDKGQGNKITFSSSYKVTFMHDSAVVLSGSP